MGLVSDEPTRTGFMDGLIDLGTRCPNVWLAEDGAG